MKPATLLAIALLAAPALAAPNPRAPVSTQSTEAAYTAAIEKRATDILDALALDDPAVATKVHDAVIAQYRALRDWHDANDPRLKHASPQDAAPIRASLQSLHDAFLGNLATAGLTPPQIDTVKDKMTYNKVKVTYDAYCQIVPNLTPDDKARILAYLDQAREEAMDAGSAAEKSAVFKKYKGKINNDLAARGHDIKQAYKDWGAKQKAAKRKPATQPAS